jgi:hypothetical protein
MARTNLFFDDFATATQADLNTRANWAKIGSGVLLNRTNGFVSYASGNPASYRCTYASPVSDYMVSATYLSLASVQEHTMSVRARMNAAQTTYYSYGYNAGAWNLSKAGAGTLATGAAQAIVANTIYVLRIEVANQPNGDVLIRCYRKIGDSAEVLLIEYTDVAPGASYTATGLGGLSATGSAYDTSTSGQHVDSFSIDSLDGAVIDTSPKIAGVSTNRRVVQRQSVGGTGVIPVSGTYDGTIVPASIQVQLMKGSTVVQAWTTVSGASITGKVWSGTISAPEGGWYTMQYRSLDGSGTVLASHTTNTDAIGVGEVIISIGSSTPERAQTEFQGAPNDLISVTEDAATWQSTLVGQGFRTMGDTILAAYPGIPVGFIEQGVGGTTLADWALLGGEFSGARNAINKAKTGSMGIRGVYMQVGRNDASAAGANLTVEGQLVKYRTLVAALRDQTALPNLRFFVGGSQTGKAFGGHNDQYAIQRRAELLASKDTNVIFAANNWDLERQSDETHMTQAAWLIYGVRLANSVIAEIAGASVRPIGPYINAALAVDDTTTRVFIKHRTGTDFTPTTGIANFQVSFDSGATWVDGTGARVSATEVLVTHPSRGGKAGKLAYANFEAPNPTAALRGNTAQALPAEPTYIDIATSTPFVITVTDSSGSASITRTIEVTA